MLSESPAIRPPQIAVEPRDRPSANYRALLILFTIETLAINIAQLPDSLRFDRFAFCDHGANLTLQYLVANGMRPALDFGYHYGLLPILVGRVWFAAFGATPWAYQCAMVLADLLCAWALAQMLSQLKVGIVGVGLAVLTLAYSFQATYGNFTHAIEAVLLSHALAQQLRGFRSRALALCAVALFAKPSMAYVYGLLLIILIVRDLGYEKSLLRKLARGLAPAAIVFAAMAVSLAAIFGLPALIHTAVPIEGVTNYHALNFGLFKAGREFWAPKELPWIYYAIHAAGLWIAATIFLFGSTLLLQRARALRWTAGTEAILTCAILHFVFLACFFGNQWSWTYYSYLLMIGVSVATDLGPISRRLGLILCGIAVISCTDLAYFTYRGWHTTAPARDTASLWASADERREWLEVRGLIHGRQAVMLDSIGAAELLFAGFEPPVSLFLEPGLMQSGDVQRKVDQLSSAEFAIVPVTIAACSGVPDAPQFKDALKSFDLAWEGKHFEVFRRRAAP